MCGVRESLLGLAELTAALKRRVRTAHIRIASFAVSYHESTAHWLAALMLQVPADSGGHLPDPGPDLQVPGGGLPVHRAQAAH